MDAMPWPIAWMRHGDATTMKPTQNMMWDVIHEDPMPHAWMRSHRQMS